MLTSQEILKIFNQHLEAEKFDRKPTLLYDPVRYVLSIGGKRLRPVLMMLSYNLYREDVALVLPQALGIETYHNYTLLHDDLMDKADLRRGNQTVHKRWNENAAILSGDSMLVLAYQFMASCNNEHLKQVMDLFTETALEIGEGQQYDMEFEDRNDVTEAEYIEMIRLKTSVLLACAMKIGALVAGAPTSDADLLYAFGEKLGMAFQLQDDYLDVYGDEKTFGKKIGGDIMCNKKTYLLINAFLRADEACRKELTGWLNCPDSLLYNKVASVTAIYNALGIPELCRQTINNYFSEAKTFLDKVALPETRKQELWAYAMTLLGRQS